MKEKITYKETVSKLAKSADHQINLTLFDFSTTLAIIFDKSKETTLKDLFNSRQKIKKGD